METTEKNRLIAEFMGFELKEAMDRDTSKKVYYTPFSQTVYQEASLLSREDYEWVSVKEFLPEELKFHASWEWLMLVVEKIEAMGYYFIDSRNEDGFYAQIGDRPTLLMNPTVKVNRLNSKKEALYNAVVEFIKIYNENR